jgi:hypothetical protein
VNRANFKQNDTVDRCSKKRAINNTTEPDMRHAENWMKDALALADSVIAEGDGDLTATGEFADVEFKVSHSGLSRERDLTESDDRSTRYCKPVMLRCSIPNKLNDS